MLKKIFSIKRYFLHQKIKKKFLNVPNYNIVYNDMNIDNVKVAVYTCIIGEYDSLKEPLCDIDNIDFYLITDDKSKYSGYVGKFNIVEFNDSFGCNTLKNRYVKMNQHKFFKEYDYSVYIDGSIKILGDIRSFIKLINDNTGLAIHAHNHRNCIYDEAKVLKILKKGSLKNIDSQIMKYTNNLFPKNFGMYEACVLVTDLSNDKTKGIYNDWYNEFIRSGSFRDQLSLPYILWRKNFKYLDVGILSNDVHSNKLLEKNKHV